MNSSISVFVWVPTMITETEIPPKLKPNRKENTDFFLYSSRAEFSLAEPRKLMRRLIKHFRHKVPAEELTGFSLIHFAEGEATLQAESDKIICRCFSNDQSQLQEIEDTLERHISRMEDVVAQSNGWRRVEVRS